MADWGIPQIKAVNGSFKLVYPRKGVEPPPEIPDWSRSANMWEFDMAYPRCTGQMPVVLKRCCGILTVAVICNQQQSAMRAQPVSANFCLSCPYHRSPSQ